MLLPASLTSNSGIFGVLPIVIYSYLLIINDSDDHALMIIYDTTTSTSISSTSTNTSTSTRYVLSKNVITIVIVNSCLVVLVLAVRIGSC